MICEENTKIEESIQRTETIFTEVFIDVIANCIVNCKLVIWSVSITCILMYSASDSSTHGAGVLEIIPPSRGKTFRLSVGNTFRPGLFLTLQVMS